MALKTETVHDDMCPWPYFQAYGMVTRPQKPKRKRRAARSSKRSLIAKDLFTPKYKPRVVPNKKRRNTRGKVTLGGDE